MTGAETVPGKRMQSLLQEQPVGALVGSRGREPRSATPRHHPAPLRSGASSPLWHKNQQGSVGTEGSDGCHFRKMNDSISGVTMCMLVLFRELRTLLGTPERQGRESFPLPGRCDKWAVVPGAAVDRLVTTGPGQCCLGAYSEGGEGLLARGP